MGATVDEDHFTEDARDLAEICKKNSLVPKAPDALTGRGKVTACLIGVVAKRARSTHSPKTCLKLPLFLALAMALRELKYAWPLPCSNRYILS